MEEGGNLEDTEEATTLAADVMTKLITQWLSYFLKEISHLFEHLTENDNWSETQSKIQLLLSQILEH